MHRGFGEAGEEIVERGISSRLEVKKKDERKKRKVSGWGKRGVKICHAI